MPYARMNVETYGIKPPWNVALASLVNDQLIKGAVVDSHQIPCSEKGGPPTKEELRTRYDTEDAYLDWNPQVRTDTI